MIYRDRNEIVDSVKTLDEAKQLIFHLLESEEHIFNILLYELRTPLMIIKGYTEIVQKGDYLDDHPYFFKIISHHTEGIAGLLEVLRNEILTDWHSYQKSFLLDFPLESVDPNPILIETISKIQRNVDSENEIHAHNAEWEQKKGIVRSPTEPSKLEVRIDENLPAIQFNSGILESIMSDVTWFLSEPYYRGDILIAASSDEQWVRVTFSYSTYSSGINIQDDFQRFESVQTAYKFAGESLFLYNIWRRVKAYSGELSLNFQEKTETNKSLKTEITINLKR